ncbi:MAG: stage II sporulation protein M [Oscillospiraceae bacterium]|jgi:hypothetical protein|nr:stage II sporulation protein M [Oscillospiraceae bacterium]
MQHSFTRLQNMFRARGVRASRLPGLGAKKIGDMAGLLSENWQKLALLALYGLGLLLGAKTAANAGSGWQARLLELLRDQRLRRAGQSVFANAAGYFGVDALFLAAAFLLGLCAAGLPLVLLLPVLRGLGMGCLSGWLYLSYGFQGVGYCVLTLYLPAIVSMLILLSGCKQSMLMSGDMALMISGRLEQAETAPRQYFSRYLMLLPLSACAALLHALCFNMFAGMFEI